MPEPLYQRLLGWAELSTRTARTFAPSNFRSGVRSKVKLVYPYGWAPSLCALRYTVASWYTPSNSTVTRFPFQLTGARNILRYQPVPPGKKPPPEPLGLSLPGALSMLQSWGRSTFRQEESSNCAASAPAGSPSRNFQPASALRICRGDWASAAQTQMPNSRLVNMAS